MLKRCKWRGGKYQWELSLLLHSPSKPGPDSPVAAAVTITSGCVSPGPLRTLRSPPAAAPVAPAMVHHTGAGPGCLSPSQGWVPLPPMLLLPGGRIGPWDGRVSWGRACPALSLSLWWSIRPDLFPGSPVPHPPLPGTAPAPAPVPAETPGSPPLHPCAGPGWHRPVPWDARGLAIARRFVSGGGGVWEGRRQPVCSHFVRLVINFSLGCH